MTDKLYRIGIDEVGRGPVAGPVVVVACALLSGVEVLQYFPKQELRDSKKLSEKQRQVILAGILPLQEKNDVVFGVGEVSALRIDEIGINPSIQEAMHEALSELHQKGIPKSSFVFLDGSLYADESYTQETVIKGDEKIQEISLASIFAKEYRDTKMKEFGVSFPFYGFESHVGYGTKAHYEAISKHGFTPLHRKSFLKKIV